MSHLQCIFWRRLKQGWAKKKGKNIMKMDNLSKHMSLAYLLKNYMTVRQSMNMGKLSEQMSLASLLKNYINVY